MQNYIDIWNQHANLLEDASLASNKSQWKVEKDFALKVDASSCALNQEGELWNSAVEILAHFS